MALSKLTLSLPETVLGWLPKVGDANKDKKQKPRPLSVEDWVVDQFHQVAVAQGQGVNLLKAKGYVELNRGGADAVKERITLADVKLENYRPKEALEGDLTVEIPDKNLDRLVWAVALLNAYSREKVIPNEPFDTLEAWAEDHITRTVTQSWTEIENKQLEEESEIAQSLSKAREKRLKEAETTLTSGIPGA